MKFIQWVCCFVFFGSLSFESFAQGNARCKDDLVIDSQYVNPIGSTYVPVDSWIYPAVDRLHALGYVDTAYLGMRPWPRLTIVHMLKATADKINADDNSEKACTIYRVVQNELKPDVEQLNGSHAPHVQIESAYTRLLGITGTPLGDSFHVGQTIVNDFGEPIERASNNITGVRERREDEDY